MANKRISQLPYVGNTGYTVNDIMPIVNYDVSSGTTKNTPLVDLKAYILSGSTDYYVTGGTYSGGTLVLDRQNGSVTINGFTTGTTLYEVGSGVDSTQRIGSGYYGTISGGYCNTTVSDYGDTIAGGVENTTFSSYQDSGYNFIGGGVENTISAYYGKSVIGGGGNNKSLCDFTFIGGGFSNTASNYYATISGGLFNTSSGYSSTVSGGRQNRSSGQDSTVSGGFCNTSSGDYSNVSGGKNNVSGINGTVSGFYSQTYLGSTLNGTFNLISPSSTSSGFGNGATFDFVFNTGSLSTVNLVTIGSGYVNGDLLTFDGTLFGGSSGTDDVTLNINTQTIGNFSTVSGGRENKSISNYSFVGGVLLVQVTHHQVIIAFLVVD